MTFRTSVWFGLGVTLAAGIPALSVIAQTPTPKDSQPVAAGLQKLTGENAKRAEELEKAVTTAVSADRWDEAIARAEALVALRTRVQGAKHYETVSGEWILKTLRRLGPMPNEDRVAYQSVKAMNGQAEALLAQGKYAQAQPLCEKALEIFRRLLGDDHPETASGYNNLAENLHAQGKYAEAQPLFEKALAISRRLLTDDHPSTATFYNNTAANLGAQGKYAQAQPLLEMGLEIQRRLLTDNHPDIATTYNNLAGNLMEQKKYAQAQTLYEKSLEILRRQFKDDHPYIASSYNNLAVILDRQRKYAQAQVLYEKSLEIHRRVHTDAHPETARAYLNLADFLSAQGNYSAADPLYEKALQIDRRVLSDNHPQTAKAYGSRASNLGKLGHYDEAQPLYEKSLEIYRRLYTDNHPDTAAGYNNLGLNLHAQGKYAEAQPFLERFLDIDRRLFGDNGARTAFGYDNLAGNLNRRGQQREAQPLFEKALEIRRKLLTDNHPDTARSYRNTAANLNNQGKYSEAEPLLAKAVEIHRWLLSDNHPATAMSYANFALNLDAQGKHTEAQAVHEKALAVMRRMLGDEHRDTGFCFNNLASNFAARGKYAESRELWKSAVRSFDAARLRVAFTGLDRAGLVSDVRPHLAAVFARLGQPLEAWQTLEEGLGRGLLDELRARQDQKLTAEERSRLHGLAAELDRLDRLTESTPEDLDHAERQKRLGDVEQQRRLASIALGEYRTKIMKDHGSQVGEVATLDRIQAALPADAVLVTWLDVPKMWPNVADHDGEHWGVVVRSAGIPNWISIAGTGTGGVWTDDDTRLARGVRTELREAPGANAAGMRERLRALYRQRLEPLLPFMGGDVHRMVVVPSSAMAGIPVDALFAADDFKTVTYAPSATVYGYLRDQPHADRRAGLLALGDPVYEAGDKVRDQPTPVPDHGLLVTVVGRGSNAAAHGLSVGDVLLSYGGSRLEKKEDLRIAAASPKPIAVEIWRDGQTLQRELAAGPLGVLIDVRRAPEAIAEQRALRQMLAQARGGHEFARLPGTRFEVEAIEKLFKSDDRRVRALFEAEASEPELERIASSRELGKYGFIHLATHGVINEDVPARSAIILTQTGLPDPLEQALAKKPVFDGRLSVREIQHDWILKAELVTLSACETALGRDQGGEGFVGFTQALLISGARSVCVSLWKVDDTATALLMQRFYANLLGKRQGLTAPLPKAEALREAKSWLRGLRRAEVLTLIAGLSGGIERGKDAKGREPAAIPGNDDNDRPYESPHYWAAFVLSGDPD